MNKKIIQMSQRINNVLKEEREVLSKLEGQISKQTENDPVKSLLLIDIRNLKVKIIELI